MTELGPTNRSPKGKGKANTTEERVQTIITLTPTWMQPALSTRLPIPGVAIDWHTYGDISDAETQLLNSYTCKVYRSFCDSAISYKHTLTGDRDLWQYSCREARKSLGLRRLYPKGHSGRIEVLFSPEQAVKDLAHISPPSKEESGLKSLSVLIGDWDAPAMYLHPKHKNDPKHKKNRPTFRTPDGTTKTAKELLATARTLCRVDAAHRDDHYKWSERFKKAGSDVKADMWQDRATVAVELALDFANLGNILLPRVFTKSEWPSSFRPESADTTPYSLTS